MMVHMKQQKLENQINLDKMKVETQQKRTRNPLSWKRHLCKDINDIAKVEWKK
jgi:hypothetical protein